ncbi:hypothetical protein LF1_12320 [Rubripirellula obstinata]|uniref:Prepilin-type N-terminal cleavage/methylation domain-containing protein n=1 Tax=Rubripirellula obstinata TaxID=406547 RepID=A0A5B1CG44_9BACT|nr:hypothetical protein [Rubripirellula obstinata]KAA1258709.1 hypothetical protein LF1_12320 [Rubripirellula obstinata]
MIKSETIQRRCRKVSRGGTTIIELVGVLGLLLVIGATSHRSLGNITRASQESQMSRASRLELERLAASIRQDGHSATNVKSESDNLFELSSPQRQVRYQWKTGQPIILRQVIVDGQRKAVDRFQLRVGTTIDTLVSDTETDQKRLSVKLSGGGSADRSRRFLIEVEI